MKNVLRIGSGILVAAFTLLQVACGSGTNTSANNGYSYNTSGACIQTSSGQVVSSSYCTTSNATGYSLNAQGSCIMTSTGQVVTNTYCQNTGIGGIGGTQVCQGPYGAYIWCPQGAPFGSPSCIPGTCNGTNCRGYTLFTQQGQQVICQ